MFRILSIDHNLAGRAVNTVGDGEDILKCKELLDQAFKKFEVGMMIHIAFCITDI